MDTEFQIFICFSSKDEAVAREVVRFLEAASLKCWISLRDVPPGQNYQETIVEALEVARGVVFLFSESSSASSEIKKELSLAGGLNVPVFPLRLSPIAPSGALRYELATRQWIDMFPDADLALRRLAASVKGIVNTPAKGQADEIRSSDATVPASSGAATPVWGETAPREARAPVFQPGSPGFEAIRILLARHIGPIAKVFAQKAATEASTPDDFCQRLAAHVNAPPDRAAFLRAARAELSLKS